MIINNLQQQIFEAMKAKDEIRLSTLKMLSSAFNYEKIAKQHDLSEEEELSVIRSEAKKRRDAIEAYKKAGQLERVDTESKELAVLEEYLPAQMGDEELSGIIDSVISESGASSMSDMGRVIGAVMAKAKGTADGGRVSSLVKEKLSK